MVMEAVKANGLSALPSTTNFVFVNLGDGNAELFRQQLAKEKILIRGIYRDYTGWSRVSMGRIEDVARYVKAMPKALEGRHKAQKLALNMPLTEWDRALAGLQPWSIKQAVV